MLTLPDPIRAKDHEAKYVAGVELDGERVSEAFACSVKDGWVDIFDTHDGGAVKMNLNGPVVIRRHGAVRLILTEEAAKECATC